MFYSREPAELLFRNMDTKLANQKTMHYIGA